MSDNQNTLPENNTEYIKIECPYCKNAISTYEAFISAVKNGIILLSGDCYWWIGFNCPHCPNPTTIINKYQNDKTDEFKTELLNHIKHSPIESYHTIDGREEIKDLEINNLKWVYNSFPYNLDIGQDYSKKIEVYLQKLSNDTEEVNDIYIDPNNIDMAFNEEGYLEYIEDPEIYKKINAKPYMPCSYDSSLSAMGPAIALCYYNDDDIVDLAKIESSKGIKLFPRYIPYDKLYTLIQDFCWKYSRDIEYSKDISTEFTLKDFLSSSSKISLMKNIQFLDILDVIHVKNRSDYIKDAIIPINFTIPEVSYMFRFEKERSPLGASKHKELSKIIWENFTKDYLQNIITELSDSFVSDYLSLSQNTSFSYDLVWDLKNEYLIRLADTINSNQKRDQEYKNIKEKLRKDVEKAEKLYPDIKIISDNVEMMKIKRNIRDFSIINTDKMTVLLLGESGTGKNMLAEAIHASSGRTGIFYPVDCGSLDESLFGSEIFGHVKGAFTGAINKKESPFELAKDGTIFLDEIGTISLSLQSKLLRAIQEREYKPVGATKTNVINAMIVLATNCDLDRAVGEGKFREDLYYRIDEYTIKIPPLRERTEDIKPLFKHFLGKYLNELTKDKSQKSAFPDIDAQFAKALTDYQWEGNIRELDKFAKKIAIEKISNRIKSPLNEKHWNEFRPDGKTTKLTGHEDINQDSPKRKGLPTDDSVFLQELSKYKYAKDMAAEYNVTPSYISQRKKEALKNQDQSIPN